MHGMSARTGQAYRTCAAVNSFVSTFSGGVLMKHKKSPGGGQPGLLVSPAGQIHSQHSARLHVFFDVVVAQVRRYAVKRQLTAAHSFE